MQIPFPTSPRTWADYIVYLVAIILAGGWFKEWRERKKSKADIHLSNAQAEKTIVEAQRIVLDDAIKAHGEAKERIKELEGKLKDLPRLEEGNRLLVEQNDHMKALLKLHRISYEGNGRTH